MTADDVYKLYKRKTNRKIKRLMSEITINKVTAVSFLEWTNRERYVKYFGCDGPNCGKWYRQYTPPDREYHTAGELYDMFVSHLTKNLK